MNKLLHDSLFLVEDEGGIVRLSERLEHRSLALETPPKALGLPLEKGEVSLGSLVYRLDGNGRFSIEKNGDKAFFEVPFAYDPLRTYVKDKIIDREHGLTKEGSGNGIKLDDGFTYERLISFSLPKDAEFYGLGDHVGPLSRRGYEFVCYNTDDPSDHNENKKSLYKSFPFLLISIFGGYLAVYLDSTYRSLFDCAVEEGSFKIAVSKGPLDLYFSFADDPRELLIRVSAFLGRIAMPPRYALGVQQTRWGYKDEGEVLSVVDGYKKAGIPLSAVYLDIDYMDGYRVFTFDPERFPDPAAFLEKLSKEGIKAITIVDPGVKLEKGYRVYEELVKDGLVATLDGKTYVNEVWPGEAVYPAFNDPKCAEMWGKEVASFLELGVSGFWNDMNEPASFRGELPAEVDFAGVKHDEMHNLYGFFMAKATAAAVEKKGKRPFIVTRAAFMGSQRYCVGWTGDNHSNFDSLRLLPSQIANLGISLFPFVGSDVGGFSGDATPELIRKWAAFAVAMPLFRNHSAINTRRQEPYFFDERTVEAYRSAAELRYRLVPFLYDWCFVASIAGAPIVRPLFFEFFEDPETKDVSDEILLGKEALIAPFLNPGPDVRSVYLPKGTRWFPFGFGTPIEGGSWIIAKGKKEGIPPIYVKEGSVMPLFEEGYFDLSKNPETIVLRAYPGKGKHYHYVDAGEGLAYKSGEYTLLEIENNDGKLSIKKLHDGYPIYKKARVETIDGAYEIDLQKL